MNIESAVALVDREVYRHTNKHLNNLQQAIITKVWQGRKYWEIADEYGCTEGHAKDTGSLLWKLLSSAWNKKVTKGNFRSLIERQLEILTSRETSLRDDIGQDGVCQLVDSVNFVGRQQAIAKLQDSIDCGSKIIVIQGEGGVGKTTLAQQFLSCGGFEITLEALMAKETSNVVSAAAVVEEWLQRDLNQDSGREFGVTLARLKRYLEQHRVGILLDNLEPTLNRDGRFIAAHRNYIELLRILADPRVQSVTIITSRDRLCEPEVNLTHYRLPGLDYKAWQQYFIAHQIEDCVKIEQLHHTYGGNAKAMGLLCGIIREDYGSDVHLYWQSNRQDPLAETDLKNLVVGQFERIRELDREAYLLLCRLGCYRDRGGVKIDREGLLCLLWDVETDWQRAIKSLRNRSLLEFDGSQYWLHPVVRAEARIRLQSLPDWERSHRQIAEYFTNSIVRIANIQDGLTALEAYYHYVTIHDYAAAAKVILNSRENQWGQFLTLGTTLYRLGIVQPLVSAIDGVIGRIQHDRHRSELNNILGDLYWTSGKLHQAISCQQKTIETSRHCGSSLSRTSENKYDLYYWRMLEVDSLLSLGLYHIDLGELSEAADLFHQVIDLAHNTKHHAWSEKASIGLALVNSYLDPSLSLDPLIARLYRLIIDLEDGFYNTGRFAYFMQMLGQILLNHRQIEAARTIWHRAIAFSRSSHYTQIEAKSLIGLGKIERQAHNLAKAQTYHQQAIELLEAITAKCDLAEAYFQWGVTLDRGQHIAESRDNFNKAIALYQEIVAPKQIAKIDRLLNTLA